MRRYSLTALLLFVAGCGIETAQTGSQSQPQCVDTKMCMQGSHWDSTRCACVPNADAGTCVREVLCIRGRHWDPVRCACVPNTDGGMCLEKRACLDPRGVDQNGCPCFREVD